MDDTKRILEAIDSVKELMDVKHEATNEKLNMVHDDMKMNKGSIKDLFDLDRKQEAELSKLKESTQPAIRHAKNSQKMTIAFVIASIGVFGTAFGEKLMKLFRSGA